jgi:glutamate--cysteine ligase
MQTIAGVHYNWSLPHTFWQALLDATAGCGERPALQTFIDQRYFGLIRNFQRYSWLIPYLFGASPAICRTFLQGRPSDLPELAPGTLYGPYATSLRMSDLGYHNRAQDKLLVSFNSLEEYTAGLETAIHTPDPYYQELGVRRDEHWQQLSANVLQIENEFYAGIRPKRIGKMGERPALALQRYGVEYLEVRLFDLNPMIDIGVTAQQAQWADAFLLMCLFRDSPPISVREQAENEENKRRVVNRGRQPGLHLMVHNQEQSLHSLAHELFDDMAPFAALLDDAYGSDVYSQVLNGLRQRIDNPELTPSAQVLAACRQHGGYFPATLAWSQDHQQSLLKQDLDVATEQLFRDTAVASLQEQQRLEASDQGSFDDYVQAYFA